MKETKEAFRERIITQAKRNQLLLTNKGSNSMIKNLDFEENLDYYIRCIKNSITFASTAVFSELVLILGKSIQVRDTSAKVKAGSFILYQFEEAGVVYTRRRFGKPHSFYEVELITPTVIRDYFGAEEYHLKLPDTEPMAEWESFKNEEFSLVKTVDPVVFNINTEEHPLVFESINKAQAVGWKINADILEIYTWALDAKKDAFKDIWQNPDPTSAETMLREATVIGMMAAEMEGKIFYQNYYFDFRGRKYPRTPYLNEQGSDNARGMLLREDGQVLDPSGVNALKLSLANNWGGESHIEGIKTDKLPTEERYTWVNLMQGAILSWATDSKIATGWMQADKPWQFLAACIEYRKYIDDPENYICHLEVYIDGSNNGSQHLAALVCDEVIAEKVNLTAGTGNQDLYGYIAKKCWDRIAEEQSDVLEEGLDEFLKLKQQVAETERGSLEREDMLQKVKDARSSYKDFGPLFWSKVTDIKERRKVTKRGVMTLAYGVSRYGITEQIIDDARKHGIDLLMDMEKGWAHYMGNVLFDTCLEYINKPMQLLELFSTAGIETERRDEFMRWRTPVTDFPCSQFYVKGTPKKIYVNYGPERTGKQSGGAIQVTVPFDECPIKARGKQKSGAAPNIIHSLDAAHLTMTVCAADFTVTTIHDSFGCLPNQLEDLKHIVREQFVRLYKENPLGSICRDIGVINTVAIGELDINTVLDSEFSFI